MKRIFTLLSAFALVVSASAQRQNGPEIRRAPKAASAAEMGGARSGSANQANSSRGTIFFQEDFSNGFAGSNGFGPMTYEDSGDNTIWMMATAESPAGEFSDNLDPMDSPTADNGWVIFDCDLYNTPVSSGNVEDVTGWLSTPELDCSAMSSVVVEYYQYFRYCCFSLSPLTLEVSTDGGDTWTVYPGHGDFVQSANALSDNPLYTRVDVSCAAAGQSSVLIRWGYNTEVAAGYSHYFWGIDDIAIFENTVVNDVEIVQTLNGDIFGIWEYRVTPFEQRTLEADGGLLAGVLYRNNGNTDATNTVITIEILDEGENLLTALSTDPFLMEAYANTPECPSFLLDTLYIETNWEPTEVGTYIVRASITADGTDEDPSNNSSDRVIVYSDCDYAHEDEAELDLEIGPRDSEDSPGEFDPTGYGAFFTFPNAGSSAHGLTVVFGPSCDVGAEFAAVLYQTNGDLNGAGEVVASEEYFTTEGQIPSEDDPLSEAYEYYPFDEPFEVETGEAYFCAVLNENTSPLELIVAADSDSDNDNSTGVYEISGGGDYVWFGSQSWSPAVRLILCEQVGVEEIIDDNLLTFFQISPNPAVDNTRISYELQASAPVAYEVRDMAGRVVEFRNLGRMQPGRNTITLNVSNYAAGNYTVGLVVDGARMFSKQLNVTH